MSYIFDFKDSIAYENWFTKYGTTYASELETSLLLKMLKPVRGETLLDIGCGIGVNFQPMLDRGLNITGIDPSPYMLDIAKKKYKERVELHRCFGEELPFEDNSFNHSCITTTLEFTKNHKKVIEEACRVTKDRLFIGVLNRYAIKSVQRRIKGIITRTIYNRARFFSIWEIKRIIYNVMGDVPLSWKTVNFAPMANGKIISSIEKSSIIQRFPFGTYAGIQVTLNPRYTLRPLSLKHPKIRAGSNRETSYVGSEININKDL